MSEDTTELKQFRISEVFSVDFYIEATDYKKAKDIYNKMFDKNINIGYDTWKNITDKKILGGKFHVKTIENGNEATLIEELWGSSMGEEE